MHEYIKRTDAVAEINRGDLLVGNCAKWAREIIWRCPYADVAEIRRGHWRSNVRCFDAIDVITYTCSECNFGVAQRSKYCPDCGAIMSK